jgi:hypothetical protein
MNRTEVKSEDGLRCGGRPFYWQPRTSRVCVPVRGGVFQKSEKQKRLGTNQIERIARFFSRNTRRAAGRYAKKLGRLLWQQAASFNSSIACLLLSLIVVIFSRIVVHFGPGRRLERRP